MFRAVLRLAFSVALIAALLVICSRIPGFHRATVALLMVLAIVGLAKKWGWRESVAGAIIAGIGFDYYFLPPGGFGIETLEDLVDLVVFVATAMVASQFVARSKQQRIDAEARKSEIETLYRLTNALLGSGEGDFSLAQLTNQLVEIFGVTGAALYDKHSGRIVRSGLRADAISEQALRQVAAGRPWLVDATPAFSAIPIRYGGEPVGSLAMSGSRLSEALLNAVGERIGLGLARLSAIEKAKDFEIARRAEELKSAVLDAMAHEIRNPLNCIKIAATTLLSTQPGHEIHQREMIAIIGEEANRMERFIDDAVQISHTEADGLVVEKKPWNPARLIHGAIEEMGALSGRPVYLSVPASLPPAECDKEMIVRVLKQLLSNALKYSPDHSPLEISAQFTGAAIVIDVVDSGPGIGSEEKDRIFEKHYRGRAASGTKGTGLGLASARSIVRAHGGEVWATNRASGGAAFHVLLPLTAAPAAVAARKAGAL